MGMLHAELLSTHSESHYRLEPQELVEQRNQWKLGHFYCGPPPTEEEMYFLVP